MAEISKLSKVAIGDVAAVDAVLKANIASILGLTLPSGAAFLLDTYTGAAAGYSVRRLASATTVLLRVRRDTAGGTGDDDEADVAYDSNNILSLDSAISNASAGVTATTLGQFLNVGTVGGTTYTNPDSLTVTASCFVDEWKDQSGNANHASQAVQGSQPQIHDGTVDTDLITENGKPTIQYGYRKFLDTGFDTRAAAFDLPQTFYVALSMISYTTQTTYDKVEFYVAGKSGIADLGKFELKATPSDTTDSVSLMYRTTSTAGASYSGTPTSMYLHGAIFGSSSANNYVNGSAGTAVSISEGDFSDAGLTLGASAQTGEGTFNMSEAVIWPSDQSSNRSGIETNINDHFSIY